MSNESDISFYNAQRERIAQLIKRVAELEREWPELNRDAKRLEFLMAALNGNVDDAWALLMSLVGRRAISRERIDAAMAEIFNHGLRR